MLGNDGDIKYHSSYGKTLRVGNPTSPKHHLLRIYTKFQISDRITEVRHTYLGEYCVESWVVRNAGVSIYWGSTVLCVHYWMLINLWGGMDAWRKSGTYNESLLCCFCLLSSSFVPPTSTLPALLPIYWPVSSFGGFLSTSHLTVASYSNSLNISFSQSLFYSLTRIIMHALTLPCLFVIVLQPSNI